MMHGQKNIKLTPSELGLSQCRDFAITLRHTTLFRTPLDE